MGYIVPYPNPSPFVQLSDTFIEYARRQQNTRKSVSPAVW